MIVQYIETNFSSMTVYSFRTMKGGYLYVNNKRVNSYDSDECIIISEAT